MNPIELLGSFHCERISSNVANKELIKSFSCKQNDNLQNYIRKEAWNEDKNNEKLVYLVKHQDKLLFYFSLKFSAIYEPYDSSIIEQSYRNYNAIEKYLTEVSDLIDYDFNFQNHIDRLYEKGVISANNSSQYNELRSILINNFRHSFEARNLEQDKREDKFNTLQRINKSYPAIELVHFCANDKTKDIWDTNQYKHRLGTAIFHHFVTPLVTTQFQQLGFRYLFLFAADKSPFDSLVNYYKGAMYFSLCGKLMPIKTAYSMHCTTLCQKISDMPKHQERFFRELEYISTKDDWV